MFYQNVGYCILNNKSHPSILLLLCIPATIRVSKFLFVKPSHWFIFFSAMKIHFSYTSFFCTNHSVGDDYFLGVYADEECQSPCLLFLPKNFHLFELGIWVWTHWQIIHFTVFSFFCHSEKQYSPLMLIKIFREKAKEHQKRLNKNILLKLQ